MKEPTVLPQCTACGASLFTAGDVDASQIKLNDVTVCLHCGTLLVFNADGTIRAALDNEIKDLPIEEKSWDLIRQLQQIVALRRKKPKLTPQWLSAFFTPGHSD